MCYTKNKNNEFLLFLLIAVCSNQFHPIMMNFNMATICIINLDMFCLIIQVESSKQILRQSGSLN